MKYVRIALSLIKRLGHEGLRHQFCRRLCTRTHTHVHALLPAHTHIRTHIHACTFIRTHTYIHRHTYIPSSFLHLLPRTLIHTHNPAHSPTHSPTHSHLHTHTHTHTHARNTTVACIPLLPHTWSRHIVYIFIYIYIHIFRRVI